MEKILKPRGILLFGIGIGDIDYSKLAIMCAAFIKKNMPHIPICLVSDAPTIARFVVPSKDEDAPTDYSDELTKWFDDIIVIDQPQHFENIRAYKDTRYFSVNQQFKNESRSSAYDLSPYQETLLMDCDYLVCNDTLNSVWGSDDDVMMNHKAVGLLHQPLEDEEIRLSPFGIKMYWATIVYFKKCENAKLLFDLVQHIKENWDFYKLVYEFPGTLFRNDYAFSIAIHMLNGFSNENFVTDLPLPVIFSALDTDQFAGISSPTTLHFFANNTEENWKFVLSKTEGLNVHCMNKISLMHNVEQIMEIFND